MDRDRIRQAFDAYVKNYDLSNPKIRLKYEHTYHVAENSGRIAASIFAGGDEEDRDLAWLIGVLHDIGRFEQLKRFDTFNDAQSIDHAAFGADLLFGEEHLIDSFSDRTDQYGLIEEAVRDHSRYRLPEDLDRRTEIFCNIIRDADKVDILRVNIEIPQSDIYGLPEEEVKKSRVSPEVIAHALTEDSAIPRALHRTVADHFIGHICLTYELVFPESVNIVREEGYLDRLFSYPFEDPDTIAALQKLRKHMDGEQ